MFAQIDDSKKHGLLQHKIMAKKKSPSYITLIDKKSLSSMTVPANRAARRAYKKQNNHEYIMPPVLGPYVKPKVKTSG